jgi:1,4-dihydroxy-2-naphthoyl-CoA hydrolase
MSGMELFDPSDLVNDFIAYLGLELTEVGHDRVVAVWKATSQLHQPAGILHGGVHCSVVETLATLGGALWLGDRGNVVGVNNNTDFFRAVRTGSLTSVAQPLHRGRSQQLWLVETTEDASGRTASRGQVRLQNLYEH